MWVISCTILMVIRTCSMRIAMMTALGSTPTMTSLIMSGMRTVVSPLSLSKYLHLKTPLELLEEFFNYFRFDWLVFLRSCPSQPPSMRPISLSLSARLRYFLLSMDLVSQSNMTNILTASVLRIAILR